MLITVHSRQLSNFFFKDMSATALSRAMAREPWSREYFEILREYVKKEFASLQQQF